MKMRKINKFNIFSLLLLFYLTDCDLINNSFIKPSSSSHARLLLDDTFATHTHTHRKKSCDISCLHGFFSPILLHVLDIFMHIQHSRLISHHNNLLMKENHRQFVVFHSQVLNECHFHPCLPNNI
jgi:hypothetical protein